MTTHDRRITEPLESIVSGFGLLLILALLLGIGFAVFGAGSIGGFGRTIICATNHMTQVGGFPVTHLGIAAKPGAVLNLSAPLTACTAHPSFGQRVLYSLTTLPSRLVWLGVLVLLWRMLRIVSRRGPFTPAVASAMRLLGWFVLGGTLLASVIQGLADGALLNSLLVQGQGLGDPVSQLEGALPVALLAGVSLIILARFIRLGVSMDEEIQGTV
jgi:hypothetical protein